MKSPRELSGPELEIFGDSLVARGQSQGSLINLQLARHRSPFSHHASAQKKSELELVETNREELFGELAHIEGLEAAWSLGFISELILPVRSDATLEALSSALSLPSFARLERLTLSGDHPLGDLSQLTQLRHLTISAEWDALPNVPALTLAAMDFEGVVLPHVESLTVDGGFENLTSEVVPKLRQLQVIGDLEESPDLEGLELLHVAGSFHDEEDASIARRVIHEWDDGEQRESTVVISRLGAGRRGERAVLLTTASHVATKAMLSALEAPQLEASIAQIYFALIPFTLVELRSEHPSAGGELLRQASTALAKAGHRTLEYAVSPSNKECIAWSIEPTRVRPLAMGSASDSVKLWRQAIDRCFAFDPGHSLDEALRALDAVVPELLRGEAAIMGTEWPPVTTFVPHFADEGWNFDYDDDEEAASIPFDPLDFRDQSGPRDWWKPTELEAEEAAPEEDATHELAQTSEWEEVMNETPIELESDGEERNPDCGLEPDFFDPDSVPAIGEGDVDTAQCEVCEARTTTEACRQCGRRVCRNCSESRVGRDGQVQCRECPTPTPSIRE